MARLDPHSYADSSQPAVARLDWSAHIDFTQQILDGEARLELAAPGEGPLDLDTRDLAIASVTDDAGAPLPHTIDAPHPILGSRLRVELAPGTRAIRIAYRTTPAGSALQWLAPRFLYSQCQAIHARSLVPLQDTPRIRLRYRARLVVPADLHALCAAAFVSRVVDEDHAVFTYEMEQPIPPYLIALAVGALEARELGPRSRVWAEPALVERAAAEFAPVDAMLNAAESLFGPYAWERFDLLVMPAAFPYGGMENPRLTFLTPTLLAGDRSLVNVVAHELAHAWTGNLVTNASAEHFWLNEGWTVYAERRILAALEGDEAAALHAALGRRALDRALSDLHDRPELTRLRQHLDGIAPDDAFSLVPYEKGYLFLCALENAVGRATFDPFVRRYIERFRFTAITTEELTAFVAAELPGALEKVRAGEWLDQPGLPADAPEIRSARLDALAGAPAAERPPLEWALWLAAQPRPAPAALLDELEARFHLTASTNYEVLVAWLELAAESEWAPALPRLEAVLGEVGRMKYLKPLYVALARRPATRDRAGAAFRRFRARYHPIARQVIETILRANHVAIAEVNPLSLGKRTVI